MSKNIFRTFDGSQTHIIKHKIGRNVNFRFSCGFQIYLRVFYHYNPKPVMFCFLTLQIYSNEDFDACYLTFDKSSWIFHRVTSFSTLLDKFSARRRAAVTDDWKQFSSSLQKLGRHGSIVARKPKVILDCHNGSGLKTDRLSQ